MFNFHNLAASIFGSVSTPLPYSQDLSRYREFQFGTSLLVVANHVHMKPSEATAIPQCPALIPGTELVCSNLFRPPSPRRLG